MKKIIIYILTIAVILTSLPAQVSVYSYQLPTNVHTLRPRATSFDADYLVKVIEVIEISLPETTDVGIRVTVEERIAAVKAWLNLISKLQEYEKGKRIKANCDAFISLILEKHLIGEIRELRRLILVKAETRTRLAEKEQRERRNLLKGFEMALVDVEEALTAGIRTPDVQDAGSSHGGKVEQVFLSHIILENLETQLGDLSNNLQRVSRLAPVNQERDSMPRENFMLALNDIALNLFRAFPLIKDAESKSSLAFFAQAISAEAGRLNERPGKQVSAFVVAGMILAFFDNLYGAGTKDFLVANLDLEDCSKEEYTLVLLEEFLKRTKHNRDFALVIENLSLEYEETLQEEQKEGEPDELLQCLALYLDEIHKELQKLEAKHRLDNLEPEKRAQEMSDCYNRLAQSILSQFTMRLGDAVTRDLYPPVEAKAPNIELYVVGLLETYLEKVKADEEIEGTPKTPGPAILSGSTKDRSSDKESTTAAIPAQTSDSWTATAKALDDDTPSPVCHIAELADMQKQFLRSNSPQTALISQVMADIISQEVQLMLEAYPLGAEEQEGVVRALQSVQEATQRITGDKAAEVPLKVAMILYITKMSDILKDKLNIALHTDSRSYSDNPLCISGKCQRALFDIITAAIEDIFNRKKPRDVIIRLIISEKDVLICIQDATLLAKDAEIDDRPAETRMRTAVEKDGQKVVAEISEVPSTSDVSLWSEIRIRLPIVSELGLNRAKALLTPDPDDQDAIDGSA